MIGRLPHGASHHQKVVVVDDKIAFAGGCDFGPDRWDTCDHEDDNLRRAAIPGDHPCFDARHEVMSLMDGPPARALGELFRDRWLRATGETLEPPGPSRADPWPKEIVPQFQDIRVGLSRSRAGWRDYPKLREVEALYLASIAAARSCIYLENQYFTSPMIAEALAQRLGEPSGPEIILVSTEHSPSYFDQMTMDRTRSLFIKRLKDADKFDRFRIYSPVTAMGRTIIVHAKLAIIDDVLGLRAVDYAFITPTPATHRRVLDRPGMRRARDLRGVFGWSLPFGDDLLPAGLMAALAGADAVETTAEGLRARVRVSTLAADLFLHSAFPPSANDTVFFGPDTYRFARFLKQAADGREVRRAIEIGVGSGAGATVVARHFRPRELIATDVNPAALRLAAVNLAAAGVKADLRLTSGLDGVGGPADLIVANPPFIADGGRTYRDGGDMHGARLSLDWALEGVQLLAPGGRFLLYTGSSILDGRDALHEALAARLDARQFSLEYAEIDPDIFGEQLAAPAYQDVERIAAVGAVITRRA